MNEVVAGAILYVSCTALCWCAVFYWEVVKGIRRSRAERLVEMELREALAGKHNFLVPKGEEV